MKRLIYADELKSDILSKIHLAQKEYLHKSHITHQIDIAPTVDAVSRGVHDQVRWERDVAIKQLEEHGIPFGGIAPDVVKVVRCKDCKHFKDWGDGNKTCYLWTDQRDMPTVDDAFCSYGERRTDNGK